MESSSKTFWELLDKSRINIPIIQRDYAQGREEEYVKREKFLEEIYKYLTQSNSEVLDLDFVYGRNKDSIFFPIDGQQRLTTLFLLHWYISKKIPTDETKRTLIKFAYDTRISSREFCESIINESIVIPKEALENNFIKIIKNKHWFRNGWKKDPTISAMLIMIQAIHEKFNHLDAEKLWESLVLKRTITFQMLDLGAKGFELTDELYIKMNARGKQLTPFENFKANFIQFLDTTFKDKKLKHPVKGEISYSGYFSYRIEKEWTDLFWAYRDDKTTIDNEFNNYFEFVAQLCYFKINKDAKVKADDFNNTFRQYEEIFKIEENTLFLFNSLDKLHEIFVSKASTGAKKHIDDFFASLFFTRNSLGKIKLFWNSSESDISLFEVIIKERNIDVRNKVILYCILHYTIKHDISELNDGLKKYIRVVRNLIQATRQRNDTKYNTNFRLNSFGNYWLLFEQLSTNDTYVTLQNQVNNKGTQISDSSLNNEKEKALIVRNNVVVFDLEEFNYFGSLIHQLKPKTNHLDLNRYLKAITEIWDDSISDKLKVQALIANGFEGTSIKHTKMGETFYFGKKGNWNTILASEESVISDSIISLIESYLKENGASTEIKLKSIINKWLILNTSDRSWKYYFLKYPYFTSWKNYYAWNNDFEIRMLSSESSNPLLAYHINPFVLTVCKKINDKDICNEDDCKQQYSVNSPLVLKNGMTLTSTERGWIVNDPTNILTQPKIVKYNLLIEGEGYLLKDTKDKDRVEIATDFITNL